jgi:hypothetical protein
MNIYRSYGTHRLHPVDCKTSTDILWASSARRCSLAVAEPSSTGKAPGILPDDAEMAIAGSGMRPPSRLSETPKLPHAAGMWSLVVRLATRSSTTGCPGRTSRIGGGAPSTVAPFCQRGMSKKREWVLLFHFLALILEGTWAFGRDRRNVAARHWATRGGNRCWKK